MNVPQLKAPFPWFGGKRRVASLVWDTLGDVDNYAEPFAGSLAVLLGRPHEPKTETVNDVDCYLSNFWRAVTADPDQVARLCDYPVNECDLLARHLWLVNEGARRIARMESDAEFFDAKTAAWWVWGINSWIGSGWCAGEGPWHVLDGQVVRGEPGTGVSRKRPELAHGCDQGQGVNRKLPHLGDQGRGVNRQLPHLGDQGQGDEPQTSLPLTEYFRSLSSRLRRVRVCCGDWSRIVTDGALSYGSTVGIFLDPPYSGEVRAKDLYRCDDHTISISVRDWAVANGGNPRYRIVLAGYHAEHADAMPETWRCLRYSASKSYGTSTAIGSGEGNDSNRHNEALWYSPHTLRPDSERQGVML